MEYYARSLPDEPDHSRWQKLEDHLRNVARLARSFCTAFGSSEWGYLAGRLHDLGKYRPEFQELLSGSLGRVEHSGVGAAYAFERDRERGLPLSFIIAGHHAGLSNLVLSADSPGSTLQERLASNQPLLKGLEKKYHHLTTDLTLPEWPSFLRSSKSMDKLAAEIRRRSCEFWIRFLFSALVDADRLDSELFQSPHKAALRGGCSSIPSLRQRLNRFLDAKMESLTPQQRANPVNTVRSQILEACNKATVFEPGIFSLTVPTGGGKTLSAMSFALGHAERHGLRRVIVVIPYTSIIEQNADIYRQALGAENVLEHHSNLDPIKQSERQGEEQTARQELAAENWDAPVIVTTTVQFFESLFSNQPARCRKLHNIAGSVIILDEVQSLPPDYLISILEALNELTAHYGCSVVLSTATPPALAFREGFPWGLKNNRAIAPEGLEIQTRLKRVVYEWPASLAASLDWPELAAEITPLSQALVVVHRREDARILARLLTEHADPESVFHLSALMCPAHRSEVLIQVRSRLASGAECRLVSTQLVEAGVDLDFPVVYRALAGLDSLVQAAGRCNREGKLETGRVCIFRSVSMPPQGTPQRALEVTQSLLAEQGENLDIDDPAIFESYFSRLYFTRNLDSRNIQPLRQDFSFASVAGAFKLIEDGFSCPVVVPYQCASEAVQRLRVLGPDRARFRALQPYTVSIYPQAMQKLSQAGALEVIEGVNVLNAHYGHLYDKRFGLVIGDNPSADSESLIV
ncbi:CRISPR-associated helicase Cas3' [bacterium]|nr:CRISPR-associated helicase Cas3' [bacterium]